MVEVTPGPGEYNVDLQSKIKNMTDKFAVRYSNNPFGSAKDRFGGDAATKLNPVPESLVRQNELRADLESHTGAAQKV